MQHQTADTKRRRRIAIAGLALALGVSTIAAPSILRAQSSPAASLRGTWLLSVTRSDGVVLQSLVTFLEGGDLLQDANSTAGQGIGHGAWAKSGDRQFTADFVFFRFDAPATRKYIGTREITEKIQLDAAGTTLQSMDIVQNFDATGNPDGPPLTSVVTGKRLYATGTTLTTPTP
jgi:hypothetical protein